MRLLDDETIDCVMLRNVIVTLCGQQCFQRATLFTEAVSVNNVSPCMVAE